MHTRALHTRWIRAYALANAKFMTNRIGACVIANVPPCAHTHTHTSIHGRTWVRTHINDHHHRRRWRRPPRSARQAAWVSSGARRGCILHAHTVACTYMLGPPPLFSDYCIVLKCVIHNASYTCVSVSVSVCVRSSVCLLVLMLLLMLTPARPARTLVKHMS